MTNVRGRSWEDPTPKGRQPRGATPHPRSGAAAKRSYPTSEVRGGSLEELCCIRGQGQWPRGPGCISTEAAERSYPHLRPGVAARRSNPTSKEQ